MILSRIFNLFLRKKVETISVAEENNYKKYDVFLCKKSEDVNIAKEICAFLESNGLSCFLSERDCPYSGQPNYYQTIDEALDNSTNMIVICSNPSFLDSRWVKHEWQSFSNELLSTPNKGNLITIITRLVKRDELPYTLRNLELILYDEYKQKLLYYIKKADGSTSTENQKKKDDSLHKLSDAFSFGIVIACHTLSCVSSYPQYDKIDEEIRIWEMDIVDWSSISSPDAVSTFLESFVSNFGKKWGPKFEDSLYLGSCFLLGSLTYNSAKNWGTWGTKIKLQCIKLGVPEDVYSRMDKTMSSDDLVLFRDLIKYQLASLG